MILMLSGGTMVPGRVQTISQLLTEMDAFCRNNFVIKVNSEFKKSKKNPFVS
jgi:hypothetical protein